MLVFSGSRSPRVKQAGCLAPLAVKYVGRLEELSLERPELGKFEADVFLLLLEIGNGLGKFYQLNKHSVEQIGHGYLIPASHVPDPPVLCLRRAILHRRASV